MKSFTILVNPRILSLILVISLFSSCKDDETVPVEELLTAAQWNITGLKVSSAFYNENLFGNIPDCNLDDLIEFAGGGAFQVLDNEVACDVSGGEVSTTGSWSLEDKNKKLKVASTYLSDILKEVGDSESFPFDVDQESWTFRIEEISSSTLRLRYVATYTHPGTGIDIDVNLDASFEAAEE